MTNRANGVNGANGDLPPAVRAEALSVHVEAKALLDRIGVRVDRGQFAGLIGPNGAGKSTLLRALSGIMRASEGAIALEGADLQAMPARQVAAMLALVPQIAPYTQGFTAFELILMGRYPHLGPFQVEGATDGRLAREAAALTGSAEFLERTLDTLSGGERQRVFLARALAQQPRVLLLDEPTANLDILHQLTILGLVRELVDGGLTAIAAIHDLNLAARYCDRLVLLGEGKLLAEGTPEQVLTPAIIASAFGVRASVSRDPATDALAISLIGPAERPNDAATVPPAGDL